MIKIPVSDQGLWVLKRRVVQDESGMWKFEQASTGFFAGVRLLLANCSNPKLKLPPNFQYYDTAPPPVNYINVPEPGSTNSGRRSQTSFQSSMSSDSV